MTVFQTIVALVLVPLTIGIVGNLISLVVTRRRDYERQLRDDAVRLRNILFKVERHFALLATMPPGTNAVFTFGIDNDRWYQWADKCEETRQSLFFLFHSFSLKRTLKDNIFRSDIGEPSVREHLESIQSFVLLPDQPKNYGIIECATDAINLINETRRAHDSYAQEVARWKDREDELRPEDICSYEEALRTSINKIVLHRKFVQNLAARIPFLEFANPLA